MSLTPEERAKYEKELREHNERRAAASAQAPVENREASQLVGSGSWLAVGVRCRNRHSLVRGIIVGFNDTTDCVIELPNKARIARAQADMLRDWKPTANANDEGGPEAPLSKQSKR